MIHQILKDLQKTWGLSSDELDDINDKIEEFGHSCYTIGHNDGIEFRSNQIELYYKGFSYAKKSDNE